MPEIRRWRPSSRHRVHCYGQAGLCSDVFGNGKPALPEFSNVASRDQWSRIAPRDEYHAGNLSAFAASCLQPLSQEPHTSVDHTVAMLRFRPRRAYLASTRQHQKRPCRPTRGVRWRVWRVKPGSGSPPGGGGSRSRATNLPLPIAKREPEEMGL